MVPVGENIAFGGECGILKKVVVDMDMFILKEILDTLSHTSTLGRSLKQISLRQTPLEEILADIARYRAIHLYYQRDNLAYPIEVQLWCGEDYQFNIWSHQYVYKYRSPEIGKQLYNEYRCGKIMSEQIFLERLKYWENEYHG